MQGRTLGRLRDLFCGLGPGHELLGIGDHGGLQIQGGNGVGKESVDNGLG